MTCSIKLGGKLMWQFSRTRATEIRHCHCDGCFAIANFNRSRCQKRYKTLNLKRHYVTNVSIWSYKCLHTQQTDAESNEICEPNMTAILSLLLLSQMS